MGVCACACVYVLFSSTFFFIFTLFLIIIDFFYLCANTDSVRCAVCILVFDLLAALFCAIYLVCTQLFFQIELIEDRIEHVKVLLIAMHAICSETIFYPAKNNPEHHLFPQFSFFPHSTARTLSTAQFGVSFSIIAPPCPMFGFFSAKVRSAFAPFQSLEENC